MRRVRTYVGAFLSPWGCHVSVSRLVSVAGTIAVGVALVFVAPGVPAYSDSTAPTAETSTTPDSSLAETSAPAETSQPPSESDEHHEAEVPDAAAVHVEASGSHTGQRTAGHPRQPRRGPLPAALVRPGRRQRHRGAAAAALRRTSQTTQRTEP